MKMEDEEYVGDMGKKTKGGGDMGKSAGVPVLGTYPVASDPLHRKDCQGGQPCGTGSTKVFGTGKVSGGSRKGNMPSQANSGSGGSGKKGKRLGFKG